MQEYRPVLEAERLENSYLGLFLRGYAVHSRDHRQHGDGKEEHGQYRAHRLALRGFAHSLLVNDMVALRDHHQRPSELFLYRVLKLGLVHSGTQVYLGEDLVGRLLEHIVRVKSLRLLLGGVRRKPGALKLFRDIRRDPFFKRLPELRRGDVRESEHAVIGHDLVAVRNADHMLAGFNQTDRFAGHLRPVEFESDDVAERDTVCRGEFVGKPYAAAVLVVCAAAHYGKCRDRVVLRNVERERLFAVAPHLEVDRKIPRRRVYAVDRGDLLKLVLREARFGIQAEIGVIRILEEVQHVVFDRFPLHVEAEENAYSERHHHDHGDELRLVAPRRAQQFAKEHHHSTSSAESGFSCSSIERIFPFLTRITTSAIFAIFWLCVTITIVLP